MTDEIMFVLFSMIGIVSFGLNFLFFSGPFVFPISLENESESGIEIVVSPETRQKRRPALSCGRNKDGVTGETDENDVVQQPNLVTEKQRSCREGRERCRASHVTFDVTRLTFEYCVSISQPRCVCVKRAGFLDSGSIVSVIILSSTATSRSVCRQSGLTYISYYEELKNGITR